MVGRIAILSDIHGNSPAFKAVLEDIDRMGCEQVLVLGDIINGIDPAGTMALIHGLGERAVCIKGNAEQYTLTPDLDELPNRNELENQRLIQLIQWFRAQLSIEDLAWLASLPDSIFWQGACLVHDSPIDRFNPSGWHIPGLEPKYQEWFFHSQGIQEKHSDDHWQEIWDWMEDRDVCAVFCGHTHEPFIRQHAGRWVGNAGSAGFTLDGDPRPSWLLMEGLIEPTNYKDIKLTIRRVNYDIERVLNLFHSRPDFMEWTEPEERRAYAHMYETGVHWQVHLKNG